MHILNEFIDHEIDRGKSPQTTRSYKYKLTQFEKWLDTAGADLYSFSRSDVQQYIDSLTAKKKSAATINAHYAALRAFARFTKKEECINDIRIVKAPNLYREAPIALERKEVLRIMREVDRSHNKRDMAIILTLIYTGIRVSELTALDRDDIEISDRKGILTVRQGKGNKERKIPLHKEARRAIELYLKSRESTADPLFLSNRQKRISVRSVQKICNDYGVNVHKFRHTFVTDLVDNGYDDKTIQTMTGHESPAMITRYRSVREEDKINAIESLYMDKD
ncbi:tyrosine-type recombinase/integrase [Bacillus sp. NPDC077411]|uniref:tyrosine-type recombinase/integrase n=1 Tax=Bacillus sp. NPDC077411 TaxID=3363947 RepID=UPI0037C6352D